MLASLAPLLVAAALVVSFWRAAHRADAAGHHRKTTALLAAAMTSWIALCTAVTPPPFSTTALPSWQLALLACAPLAATALALLLLPSLRALLRTLVRRLPLPRALSLHGWRLAAILLVPPALDGTLPTRVMLAAVPEILAGLSALYIARHAAHLSDRLLLLWNTAGLALLVNTAALLSRAALIPAFICPTLLLAHLLAIARITRRSTPAFG